MSYSHLLDLADDGSLARGHAYAAEGRVRIVSTGTSGVAAVAQGSTEYDVGLDRDGGTCTCPVGLRGQFCKHLVATVLVLDGDAVTEAHDVAAPPKLLMASAATGDLSLLRPAVDSLRVRGHLDWRRANGHGNKAHLVVDELEQVLSPATADAMLPLIERAIDHLIRAILRSDDSSGIQGDAVGRLLLLHEKAAGVGQPDPKKLVRWMVKVGFAEHGFFHVDPVPYADALGERGLAAYEKEVDKRLAANPGDFYPGLARQRLAVLARDIPTIVELVGGPLDRPYHFVQLVAALQEIGADDEALDYAVRGVTASPVAHQTIPLYDTAVRMLHERGEHDEALRLRRQQFHAFPAEPSYASLRRAAGKAGDWPTERLAALDVLLERNPRAWLTTLLQEDAADLAWDASWSMELDPSIALMLLRARAKTHPAEVFEGYVELIDHGLTPADRGAYAQGVAHLGELRRAAAAAGRSDEYDALVADLLEKHRRRPTLVAMLSRLPPAGGRR